MENRRWILRPLTVVILAAVVVFGMMDVTGSADYLMMAKDNTLTGSAAYFFSVRGCLVGVVGYCLAMLAGATLYAEDFEENAVYMRIQRMGRGRYIRKRIAQTAISSFLIGTAAMLLEYVIFSVFHSVPLFPVRGEDVSGFSESSLLNEGHYIRYLIFRCTQNGFCYMYYALTALLLSAFVPKRKIVVAIPALLWYLNQFILVQVSWIPTFLKPSNLFASNSSLGELLNIPDETGQLMLMGILAAEAGIIYILFYFRLGKKGIFGGDTE